MTINLADNSPRISYSVAQGVTQTSFAVPFEFFDNGDLNVYVDGTLKTITTDYTVSGGDGSTGTVSMSVTGGTGGSTVVITRDIALERTTDFPVSGAFNIVALNTELDRLVAVAADLDDLAGRGVKLSDFDTAATLTLPLAADRVNKVLAFNSAGDTLVSQELGVWKGDWAASTAYVERDLVRDSSDGSIYIVTSAHTSSGSTPLDTNTNSSKYSVIFDIGAMIAGTVTMTGDLSVQGNTTLGNAATDTVTITADVASNILPSADNTYDLGGTGAEWKDVYIDGVAYVDSIAMPTTTVTDILDEDTMSSNSATALATQQSIKAYVDAQVATADALSEVLGNGNTTGGTNIVVDSGDTLDVNGALDASGNITLNGSFPTGTNNVGLGSSALASVTSTSQQNTAIGANAGDSITTGDFNTAIGFQALGGATTNSLNTAIGHNALLASVGTGNIALGGSSGLYLTSGSRNVIIGGYDGNEGGLDIRTSSNNLVLSDGDGNIRLYANSSGNVGIANVSPSTALDVTGTVTATGGAFTGNVTFGDNNKALFGAGSDLQIYHDGSNSYIDDANTGNLTIRASQINFDKYTGEAMARFRADGNTELFYDNSAKLATTSTGIDVTGTVTADGLEIDKGGIGETASFSGDDASGARALQIISSTTTNTGDTHSINAQSSTGIVKLSTSNNTQRLAVFPSGDISFYEDTGTTAKFFWDASTESLGIGTSSPSAPLDVRGSGASLPTTSSVDVAYFARNGHSVVQIISTPSTAAILAFGDTDARSRGAISYDNSNNSLISTVNGSEAMRIDSSGRLLVGKTSNSNSTAGTTVYSNGKIEGVRDGGSVHQMNRLSSDGSILDFQKDGSTVGSILATSGDLGIGTSDTGVRFGDSIDSIFPITTVTGFTRDNAIDLGYSSSRFKDLYLSASLRLSDSTNTHKYSITATTSDALIFYDTTGNSERMRIDSSGNLLVGKTSGSLATAGSAFYNYGLVESVRDGDKVMTLNRLTSDGTIIDLRKDGSTVGSIGAVSGDLWLGSSAASHAAIRFANGSMFPVSNTGGSSDGLVDIGDSLARFKDLYLSGGVYLGGTGSANKLDDYEEGTYQSSLTPNTSGTITLLTAYDVLSYTKVGRAVTVTGDLVVSSTSSPVGTSVQLALPFTIGNLSELSGRIGGAVSLYDASATRTVKAYVGIEGNSYISVIVDPNTLTTSDSITISLTYFTA